MRAIDIDDERIASILVIEDIVSPEDDSTDVVVRLRDGRRFTFTVLSLGRLQRLLERSLSFVAHGVLIVKQLSDAAIADAVRSALRHDDIERLGVLQPFINQ